MLVLVAQALLLPLAPLAFALSGGSAGARQRQERVPTPTSSVSGGTNGGQIAIWSAPTNLSNTPQASAHPAAIADDFGYVHVFWSEEVGGEPMGQDVSISNTGNTIYYARWDGASWLPPIDILYVPGESLAEWPRVAIDQDNMLHVVWTSVLNVYYSNAPAWAADSARAWSEPVSLTDDSASAAWGTDIAVDPAGNVHVVYATGGAGAAMYYTRSFDDGATWESASQISSAYDPPDTRHNTVQIISDSTGRLHVVWRSARLDSGEQTIHYARSLDGGITWNQPLEMATKDEFDFAVALPYLAEYRNAELHLIYADGPGSVGRFHRISSDGGATWSVPYHIITEMVGINGYVIPVVDGLGRMHLVVNMRTLDTQTVGIYHARWLGSDWSQVEPVDVSIHSAHHPAAAVRLGAEIHVLYTQLDGGEIWHVRGMLPAVPLQTPAPLPSDDGLQAVQVQATADQRLQTSQPLTAPVHVSRTEDISGIPSTSSGRAAPRAPNALLVAAGASLAVVIGIVAWTRMRQRQWRLRRPDLARSHRFRRKTESQKEKAGLDGV
jgi:hypothetical protein